MRRTWLTSLPVVAVLLTSTGVAAAETSSNHGGVVNSSVNKSAHVLTTAVPLMAAGTSTVATKARATVPIGAQLAELKGSDTIAGDDFGTSVAISGTTVIVGADGHANGAGRAYVFSEAAGVWKQTAELVGSDTVANDGFGTSVAISGTTIVVGAASHANGAGRAYVFTKTAGVWKQTAELQGSDTVGGVGGIGDFFGISLAIFGTTIVVGAGGHANSAGRAYVFTKTAGVWKQTAELKGSDIIAHDSFGDYVAILGTTIVVGADGYANGAGRAYVFSEAAGVWKQTAELVGSDTVAGDIFGAVAISPSTVVVGANGHAKNAGRVYVFSEAAGVWKQTAELKGSDTTPGDCFGDSVTVSGSTAIVGAYCIAGKSGAAYVFTKTTSGWHQDAEMEGSDTADGDLFGTSVAISGTTIVVGAASHANGAGRAYVFEA